MRKRRRSTRSIHRAVNVWLLVLSLIGLVYVGTAIGWDRLIPPFPVLEPAEQPPPSAGSEPQEPVNGPAATADNGPTGSPVGSAASPSPEPTPEYKEAVWMAVGDIMMHTPLLPGAYDSEDKRYRFAPYFEEVKPILEQGDWVMANLETPVAGKSLGFHGYPNFNAPEELLEAIRDTGFSIVTLANNHALDQGADGLLATLKQVHDYGLATKGAAASQAQAEEPLLIERNGITMGLLAYTYGTNGYRVPEDMPYLVSYIDEQSMAQDIQKTRDAGADFIVVAIHFGTEYETQPNDEQKQIARSLIAAGADIVAGAHAHVLQPYEWVDAYTADRKPRQGLILYSMGNFLSNQRGDTKDYGAIFQLTVRKYAGDQTVRLERFEITPTWVYRYIKGNAYQYRILPIRQTLSEEASGKLTKAQYDSLQSAFAQLTDRLESMQ